MKYPDLHRRIMHGSQPLCMDKGQKKKKQEFHQELNEISKSTQKVNSKTATPWG